MLCDECGSPTFVDEARGEIVCTQCSLVVQPNLIDMRPEQAHDSETPLGHGPAISINTGVSLMTQISATGRRVSHVSRAQMSRLARLDGRIVKRKDRVTKRLYSMVATMATRTGLSDAVRDRAFYVVKRAYEKQVLRGQEFSVLVSACVYLAARESKRFIDLKTFSESAGISRKNARKQVMRAYIAVKRSLALQPPEKSVFDILPMAASQLGLPRSVEMAALNILKTRKLTQKPEADVAAALYMASEPHSVSQKAIATICGTTEVSARVRFKAWSESQGRSESLNV